MLSLSAEETSFARRGFSKTQPGVQARLEEAGQAFVEGYNLALDFDSPAEWAEALARIKPAHRGFAFEGGGMAISLMDCLMFRRPRALPGIISGAGYSHTYMLHVGAGWVLGRLPVPVSYVTRNLDPLLSWLALDGFGFHEGFFHAGRSFQLQRVPLRLKGYQRRVFHFGLGRSLWFVTGAVPVRIASIIARFPTNRQADLWSGVGLAATYAGGVKEEDLLQIREVAGENRSWVAQGAAFAAKARQRAGNMVADTEQGCRIFCGMTADEAARLTDHMLDQTTSLDMKDIPRFERWRQFIHEHFVKGVPSLSISS